MNNNQRYYKSILIEEAAEKVTNHYREKARQAAACRNRSAEELRRMQKGSARKKSKNTLPYAFIICLLKHAGYNPTEICRMLNTSRPTVYKHLNLLRYISKDGKIYLSGPFQVGQLHESFPNCIRPLPFDFLDIMQEIEVDHRTIYEILRYYDLIDDLTNPQRREIIETLRRINGDKIEILFLSKETLESVNHC